MNKLKKAAHSTQKFVEDHKVGLAFLAGIALVSSNASRTIKGYDSFLKEHNLYEEYMNR